ncbi:MAG: hypothetical protein IJ120_02215 [Solobacterium sp.]|nr:hypothetical protein [Solobacterium sp.]
MSNIIRLNQEAPNDEWIVMSNQGTDCFLDLLIAAADAFAKTPQQEKLISFLKDQKDINETAPGTAGFDLDEMPWQDGTLKEDKEFLCNVTAAAQNEETFEQLPYEVNADIVLPWLKQFCVLTKQMDRDTVMHEDFETLNCSSTEKKGNNWTAYYDPDTGRYFAEIMYTSREGREQYDYEITQDIYSRLGTFADDTENEHIIKTAKMTYSFENTMYGTLGPERTVWDEEANEAMKEAEAKQNSRRKK